MRIKKGLSCILVGSVFLGFCYFMIKMDENRMTNLDSSTNSIKTTYTTKKSKDSIMYTPHFTYIVNGQIKINANKLVFLVITIKLLKKSFK